MKMWCLDDIGRDSWDWVRPPARGEHASTSQNGVEAPRLLTRSLPRLYYDCCCYVLLRVVACCCVLRVVCCCVVVVCLLWFVVVVVVVEWLYYSKTTIIVRWADLSDFLFVHFRRQNVCFCFTSNEKIHFSSNKR